MTDPQKLDWNHLRAFWVTAEQGSLSAAARRLGQTQPTLSRQVAALETAMGVVLFERVGRSLQLTQAGADLLHHTRAMGQAADRLALTASGQSQSVEGKIKITASDMISAYALPEVLRSVFRHAPRLQVEVVASNDLRDILRREADIAIRHVRPEQPDLIARLVQDAKAHFYAASSYLDRAGRPERAADLSRHAFIGTGDPARLIQLVQPLGIELTEASFRLRSENALVAWEYVRQGFGIVPMWDRIGDETPGLERVLPMLDPVDFPIWLVTHRELHTSRRIRLVFDLLAAFFAQPSAAVTPGQ